MADAPDLADAVDSLYAASPADFVRIRAGLVADAKAAGDSELATTLKALRKPSAAAHLVNRWVRDEPDALAELRDLGERLRAAQAHLDGAAMKTLAVERHSVIPQLAAQCTAGESAATREQVAATLTAALADPQAQAAVDSGALVSAISYSGFGEVDLSDAIATPLRLIQGGASTVRGSAEDSRDGPRAAQQDAARRSAVARSARARAALERADEAVEAAHAALGQAQDRLKTAEKVLRDAETTATAAEAERDTARGALTSAEEDLPG